jgi:hypothetical protein
VNSVKEKEKVKVKWFGETVAFLKAPGEMMSVILVE